MLSYHKPQGKKKQHLNKMSLQTEVWMWLRPVLPCSPCQTTADEENRNTGVFEQLRRGLSYPFLFFPRSLYEELDLRGIHLLSPTELLFQYQIHKPESDSHGIP